MSGARTPSTEFKSDATTMSDRDDRLRGGPLILVERVWRMRNLQTSRILDCAIYQTVIGLQVRAAYNPRDVLYVKTVDTVDQGRQLALELRASISRTAAFEKLPESLRR